MNRNTLQTNLIFMAFIAMLLSGCTSVTKVQQQEIEKIKRVAIVGFDLFVPYTNSLQQGQNASKHIVLANTIYDDISDSLATQMGWLVSTKAQTTLSISALGIPSNKSTRSGLSALIGRHVHLQGILPSEVALELTSQQKSALAKHLGIDALIMFNVKGNEGSSVEFFDTLSATKYELVVNDFHLYSQFNAQNIAYLDNIYSGLPENVDSELEINGITFKDTQINWLLAASPLLASEVSIAIKAR